MSSSGSPGPRRRLQANSARVYRRCGGVDDDKAATSLGKRLAYRLLSLHSKLNSIMADTRADVTSARLLLTDHERHTFN